MARLFLDENVEIEIADGLRALGHDVLTTQQAGRHGEWDFEQLKFAAEHNRILVTGNREDFKRHDKAWPQHVGIISYTAKVPVEARAARIDEIVKRHPDLSGTHICMTKREYMLIARSGQKTEFKYRNQPEAAQLSGAVR